LHLVGDLFELNNMYVYQLPKSLATILQE